MTEIFIKNWNNLKIIGLIIALAFFTLLPLFFPLGWISLFNEILILGLAAYGLNLLVGYAGMISFGPAGFYAIGAYATALTLVYTKIPFGIAFIFGPVIASITSVIIGWFCIRHTQVYFSLLTLAFSQIIHTIIFGWYGFTRGDDGIVDIPVPEFFTSIKNYYYFTLIVFCACLFLFWRIVNSPFGKTIQALRENWERTGFIGINVRKYRLGTFVLSSFFLGIAGSLYCGFNKNVFPVYGTIIKSADMIMICVLGGIYSFFGPIVGSIVYVFLDKLTTSYTQYWPLVLGLIMIIILLFLRGGIVGYTEEKISEYKQKVRV